MLTRCASGRAIRSGRKACVTLSKPVRLTATVAACLAIGTSRNGPPKTTPALWTSKSIGPPAASTCPRTAVTCSTDVTSSAKPSPFNSLAVAAARPPSMSVTITRAPALVSAWAIARPRPAPAPVIKTRLPLSRIRPSPARFQLPAASAFLTILFSDIPHTAMEFLMARTLMIGCLAIVALWSLPTAAVRGEEKVDIEGNYEGKGTNPNGGTYEATVEIKKNGDTYAIKWDIGGNETYEGIGIL